MKFFIGLCGRNSDGFESSGRGESRWAQSLVRCLSESGEHTVFATSDGEEVKWGKCKSRDNVLLVDPVRKPLLVNEHFDVAIFSSWQDDKPEKKYINADKYLYGIMGWKTEIMKDGYFNDNEYVIRWFRSDLENVPDDINFKDRNFLLAQPFGRKFGKSKFENQRIGWTAKEAFLPTTPGKLNVAARRHLVGAIDACKETGAQLEIFSCDEVNPINAPLIKEWKLDKRLESLGNQLIMCPSLPFKEYQEELKKCSVVVPISFAGSVQESIFNGIVPLMYRDSMFSDHEWIEGICSEMTYDTMSTIGPSDSDEDILSAEQIKNILVDLLTSEETFNEYLYRLRPMVIDNLDSNVIAQLNRIMKHNG